MAGLIPGARLDRAGGRRSRVVRGGHRLHRGPDPGVHDGRASGARPRPRAGDGAVHRHRRLDRDGGQARRHARGRNCSPRTTSGRRPRSSGTEGPTSTRPATGCSRRSTVRRERCDAHRRSARRSDRSGSRSAPAVTPARSSSPATTCSGIAVHIGARVAALAGPSEVLVSSTVKDLVAGSGLSFEDAGEHELKGVPDSWHLYRVVG